MRRINTFWLYDILQADTTFKWISAGTFNNRPQNIIEVKEGPQRFTLYFDDGTKLLSKYELKGDDPIFGDTKTDLIFHGYKPVGNIMIPAAMEIRSNDQPVNFFIHMETTVNTQLDSKLFEFPEGYKLVAAPPPPTMTEIGKNIFFIHQQITGYNATFVNFTDHILVLDAPIGNPFSKRTMDSINAKFPGKPVTQVVLSHYHSDHTSGLPLYVAKKAGVIIPDGIQKFVSDVLSVRHSIQPNPVTDSTRNPLVTIVKSGDKIVVEDKNIKMEIYNVSGDFSHVKNILMVYFPKEKILWQADMLIVDAEPGKLRPGFKSNEEFEQILKKYKLNPGLIIGTHGRVGTMKDLRELIEKKKQGPSPFFE